jgi:hypothetical protein
MVLYSFIPYIKGENDFNLKKVDDLNYEDFLKIFDWYQIQINKLSKIFHIEIKIISHISNKIYFVSNQKIDDILLEDFVDPDSDGNYPIILSDQRNYLVYGKNISIIDHS